MCSIFITVQHSVLLPDEIYRISVSALLSISVHRIFAGKIIGATYIQFYNDIFFLSLLLGRCALCFKYYIARIIRGI